MKVFNKDRFVKDVIKAVNKRPLRHVEAETGIPYVSLYRVCKLSALPNTEAIVSFLAWIEKPFEYYVMNKKGGSNEKIT